MSSSSSSSSESSSSSTTPWVVEGVGALAKIEKRPKKKQ